VEAWEEPRIQVDFVKKARARSQTDAEAVFSDMTVGLTKSGDTARLVANWPQSRWNGNNPNVELRVRVPAALAAEAALGAGRIDLTGLQGDLTLDTGAGDVHVLADQSGARVKAHSGVGRIELSGMIGDVSADTGAGTARVESPGNLTALYINSGTGLVQFIGGLTATARGDISTGAGSVEVQLKSGAEIDASTGAGRVRVTGSRLTSTQTSSNRFVGRAGDGGGRLHLESGVGSISVQV